jgi:hypothetical protein
MRFVQPFVAALCLVSASQLGAQATTCRRPGSTFGDFARDTAMRLYPSAVDSSKGPFATVGLLFDSNCVLVHHTLGRRVGRPTVDSVLARLFPDVKPLRRTSGGIAQLRPITQGEELRSQARGDSQYDRGEPWVVWAVQRTRP